LTAITRISVRFSRDLQRQLGAFQLGFEQLVAAPQLLQLHLLWRAFRFLPFGRQPFSGAGVAGLAPLRYVRAVQALPTQQRATQLRPDGQAVVLIEDASLVLAAGSGFSSTTPVSERSCNDAVVKVIEVSDPVSPRRDGRPSPVSHLILTDRGAVAAGAGLSWL
jgi:hypothetical protein